VNLSQLIEAHYYVRDVRMPLASNKDSDIEWISTCFGFTVPRDKQKTAAKIFAALVEAIRGGDITTSDELAEKVGVTRAAVVHHLNRMMGSGLVIRRHGGYRLRMQSIEGTITEVQRDITRIFENLRRVAREIDQAMNIGYRQSS